MSEINYSKKQINPLIEKYKINPETNSTFRAIINMFNEQTNYQIWAIKAVFENIVSLDVISHIKQFADENQTLIAKLEKQNLVSYKTKDDFAQLNKEINGALNISMVKHCIEQFNTKQRNMFNDNIFGSGSITPLNAATSTSFKKTVEFFKKFNALSDSRKHKLIVTASAINDIQFLWKHVGDSFSASYIWEKDDLLAFIKTNELCKGVEVVFNNGPIVILEIPNFEASKAICGNGRTAWCLTRESSYFNNYVGSKGNRQFFYFDFSKDEKNEVAHVGFTVNKSQGIVYAHSTNNNSMVGGGIRVGSKTVTVQNLLDAAKVDKSVFIHLNGIKGFNWNLDDVIAYINKNSNEISIAYNDNGRLIVKILTPAAFEKLCGNTLVNKGNLSFDSTSKNACIYVLLDLNLNPNNDNCMVTMQYSKDAYGSLSLTRMYDAYNTDITSKGYLNTLNIPTSAFLGRENIKPSILLHKYLDEKSELDAVKLIEENSDELDINYSFNENTPIFTAVNNGLFNAFKAIVSSPKFDANTVDAFGEPLICSIMYEYRGVASNNGNKVSKDHPTVKMIEAILDIANYNFNAVNINGDSAINVAAEREITNWIFDVLVTNPNVDINIVNDIDCTPLTTALRCKNTHAVEEICKRKDLKVRDVDYEVAAKNGYDLKGLLEKAQYETTIVGEAKTSSSEYAKIFAETFSKASR